MRNREVADKSAVQEEVRNLGIRWTWCKRSPKVGTMVTCEDPGHFGGEVRGRVRGISQQHVSFPSYSVRLTQDARRQVVDPVDEEVDDYDDGELLFEAGEDIEWTWYPCCRSRVSYDAEEAAGLRT